MFGSSQWTTAINNDSAQNRNKKNNFQYLAVVTNDGHILINNNRLITLYCNKKLEN